MTQPGAIILLNGASSSGKSTLARGLQAALDGPWWHYSIDHLVAAQILPRERVAAGDFAWRDLRAAFFDGFHRSLPAFAEAGNNLIVEHIVENAAFRARLLALLGHLDVFVVGVHCSLDELERREIARGDRTIGEARADFETTHTFCTYDVEIDSTAPLDANVAAAIAAWRTRTWPSAFDRMAVETT